MDDGSVLMVRTRVMFPVGGNGADFLLCWERREGVGEDPTEPSAHPRHDEDQQRKIALDPAWNRLALHW